MSFSPEASMFTRLVRMSGLSKIELAEVLGLDKGTVYNWQQSPPKYAVAYLELLIRYNRIKQ